jgi:hypothetical protein
MLEGKSIEITNTNLTELQLLSEEFQFKELSAKLCKFSHSSKDSDKRQLVNPLSRVRNAQLRESFEFIVNGTVIESEVSEAAALFPAVREQLSVDGCVRQFFVNDGRIEAADIRSLQLFLSGEVISVSRSQGLLIGFLGNVCLEGLFLCCSKADIVMNLSDLVMK